MCRILGLSRQSYYYQSKPKKDESELEEVVAEEFIRSRKAYGSRKIKKALSKRGIQISRRKISRIMKNRGLKSSYTVAYFKVHHSTCNEAKTTNVLNRKFLRDNPLEAIVTDLTYVRVGKKWNYVCFILDLFNREILGYSCGEHKDAVLVKKAFSRIKQPLTEVEIFHTDRGKEFDNQAIDELLTTFDINRSLSHKGCPFDNAVAESTYKSLKVEFVYQYTFETLQHWIWSYLTMSIGGTTFGCTVHLATRHRLVTVTRDWRSESLIMSSDVLTLARQSNFNC